MLAGIITLVTQDQKYGNLRGHDGITRIFERQEQSLRELLSEGDEVTFLHIHSPKGPAATNVQLTPCPYCKKSMRSAAHMCVCPMRPPSMAPPLRAVLMTPARIGDYMVHFVPFPSQPDRGRFFVYNMSNEEVGMFAKYGNAVAFTMGKPPIEPE